MKVKISKAELEQIIKEECVLKLEPKHPLPSEEDLEDADIIFDFGGYLDPRVVDALKMSDLVIAPVTDFGRMLDTQGFISTISEIRNYNNNIIIILNKMSEEAAKEMKEELVKLDYKYPVFEIRKSEAMEDMIVEGVPISEMIKGGGLRGWTYRGINNQVQKIINYIKGVK
jgi:cellulose biosynthesis protein BcsQ